MLEVPESLQDEAVAHLQALLRLDTTNPPGNEILAARYVKEALAKDGIEARILEPFPGRGSVVARLGCTRPTLGGIAPGDSGGPLLLVSHLDVVPADRARWSRDPFSGDLADGCLWGRGAVDMKSLTALSIACLAHLKRRGVSLRRDVILAGFADEEAGSDKGARWFVAHEPDLVRAEWALCEVGGFTLHMGGKRFYPVQVAERGIATLRLVSESSPGHGSMPVDENAVVRLARAVARLGPAALPVKVSPPAREFFDSIARTVGGTWGRVFRLLSNRWLTDSLLPRLPSSQRRFLNAIVRNTVSPTILEAGVKDNVIPGKATAILDGRVVPGSSTEEIVREVKAALGPEGEGIRVEIVREAGVSPVVSRETPLFELISKVVPEHDPGTSVVPYMISGFTDAQPLSSLGVKTYGFNPVRLPESLNFGALFHGDDERIPVDGFRWGVRVFCDLVERFCVVP